MEIQFHGANCISFATKKAKVTIDDNLDKLGLNSVSNKSDVVMFSNEILKPSKLPKDAFVIDGPGEYEIKEVSVIGIPVRGHMDEEGQTSATIYRISAAGIMMVSVGHIHPELSEDIYEKIGMVDVAIIPVGGNGYTLDAHGARSVVKNLEPKIIIPTHYQDKVVKYEVPQNPLEDFTKDLSATPEKIDKLKLKAGIIPEGLTIYQITRS
jgi:L-ascorbate metabolism protein UlaG (beta-lactamase superfamily)